MIRALQLIFGFGILIALEVMRVYYIMPFPGSQQDDNLELAYYLHKNIFWLRTIGLLIIIFPIIHFYWLGSTLSKWLVTIGLVVYLYIFMMFNYRMQADKMFIQPITVKFANHESNVVAQDQLVLGIKVNDKARAYPVEIIGYHHQVRDTIDGTQVMVTYCTVCRTGRAYSPIVDGKNENFRLVGMDHFNAMFEDQTTGSWWRQVTGEAVAGPLKGSSLKEIPSEQMTLRNWLRDNPESEILQPDTAFNDQYKDLDKFDEGSIDSDLERRDTASWKFKSWVVGVQVGDSARAYDWNDLITSEVVNDSFPSKKFFVAVEPDRMSFHAFERDSLQFTLDAQTQLLRDKQTNSSWSWSGVCVDGPLKGQKLEPVFAYQEFWHSWRTFHPKTSRYLPKN